MARCTADVPILVGEAMILVGDCRDVLKTLPADSVHCCVTSPPYWGLRDYDHDGQIGLETSVSEYVETLVGVFREVRRVLRSDGTLWLNLGDAYASNGVSGLNEGWAERAAAQYRGGGHKAEPSRQKSKRTVPAGLKPKDLIGLPWRVAFALQADGWYLRSEIIWAKPNPMPESVKDRPTRAHETVFLFSKGSRYYFDFDAVKEPAVVRKYPTWDERKLAGEPIRRGDPGASGYVNRGAGMGGGDKGRNIRSVWTIPTSPFSGSHFATFPPKLVEPCIKAGCPEDGLVLDPFAGAGTVALVANRLGRRSIGIELNPDYTTLVADRLRADLAVPICRPVRAGFGRGRPPADPRLPAGPRTDLKRPYGPASIHG